MINTNDKSMLKSKEDRAALPRPKNAEETRRRLILAARAIFSTRGYIRGGLRDISKAAGVDVALIKRYFGSKEGLYQQALHSATNQQLMVPPEREVFGEYMAGLLTSQPAELLSMMIASMNSPEANDLSVKGLHVDIYEPLASWVGEPNAKERVVRILMICSGFVIHRTLLPLEGATAEPIRKWLAQTLQSIIDEN